MKRLQAWAFRLAVMSAAVVATAAEGRAQPSLTCGNDESPMTCLTRVVNSQRGSATPEGRARRAEDARQLAESGRRAQLEVPRKTETGLDQIPALGSSLRDFLPFLQASGLLSSFQESDAAGALTLTLNTRFLNGGGGFTKDPSLQLNVVIGATDELYEPLLQRLPASDRASVQTQLLAGASSPQNLTFHASYNVITRRLGRNFAQHADTLDTLYAHFQTLPEVLIPRLDMIELAGLLLEAIPEGVDPQTARFAAMPGETRETIEAIIEKLAFGLVAREASLAQVAEARGLNLYGQLVNNQPQLFLSVGRTVRDDLFGPDLLTARVTFETGLGNHLNAALGSFNGRCSEAPAACLSAYSSFLASGQTRAAVEGAARLSFWAELVHHDDYHFVSTDPALELAILQGTGWSAGLDYGQLVAVDDEGRPGGRIDGSVRWEVPSGTGVEERFVATVTLTKKLGDVSVPFGIVYANREKFLTAAGVDKGLSAHVGLRFKLFPGL